MSRRFGRLPPLTALEGFESAARLKSFSLAAEELNITQSAVSHQIKALEEFFGLSLFNRVGRSVEPTVAGLDFLQTAEQMLDILARGKRRLNFYHRPGSVVLGTTGAFASKWLLPRYEKLQQWFPEVQPWLYTCNEIYDLETQEVDLAIWYGDGDWPDVTAIKLFHDRMTPMYAPKKFPGRKKLEKPEDLNDFPLLHDERPDDWLAWFRAAGQSELEGVEGSVFNDPGLMLESAIAGQGVALGSMVLAADLVTRKELATPFPTTLITSDAYYLTYGDELAVRPAVTRAKEWLLSEVSDFCQQMGWDKEQLPSVTEAAGNPEKK